jgi:hypothetical protein
MTRLHKGLIWASAVVVVVAVGMALLSWVFIGLLVLAFYAAVALVLLVVERARYKPLLETPPGPAWRASDERFVDPETGRMVTVYQEPATGRRAYVAGAEVGEA